MFLLGFWMMEDLEKILLPRTKKTKKLPEAEIMANPVLWQMSERTECAEHKKKDNRNKWSAGVKMNSMCNTHFFFFLFVTPY